MNSVYLKSFGVSVSNLVTAILLAAAPLRLNAAEAAAIASSTGGAAPHAVTAGLTFGLDRIEVLQAPLLGNPKWQYVAALLYIVLAFYAAKLFDGLIHTQLRKLAARTETDLDDAILELLRGPVKIVVFVVLVHLSLNVLTGRPGPRTSCPMA